MRRSTVLRLLPLRLVLPASADKHYINTMLELEATQTSKLTVASLSKIAIKTYPHLYLAS
jgi:hypothetical protein